MLGTVVGGIKTEVSKIYVYPDIAIVASGWKPQTLKTIRNYN